MRIALWTAPLGIYVVLAVLLFGASWAHPTSTWIGNDGDPKIFMWYLGWIPHQLSHLESPFVTNWIMFPSGVNILWNTSIVLPSILLWPVSAGLGLPAAYNVLATSALALSAWTMFLAANRYVHQPLAAFVGGLLYGFSPYMLAHSLGHVHVTMALFPPLVLILLDQILIRQRMPSALLGGLLGVASAAQLLTGEEVLATTVVTAAVGVALLVVLHPRGVPTRVPYVLVSFACALAVFLILAVYPLAVQFFGPRRLTGGLQPPELYVTDFYNFFIPNGMVWFTPAWALQISSHFTGNATEGTGYFGIPLILLLAVAIWFGRRNPVMRWAALLGAAMALCSLGPHLHRGGHISTSVSLPWMLATHLPVLEDVLPGRLILFAYLAAALVLSLFLGECFRGGRARAGLGAALAGVALLPLFPAIPFLATPDTAPAFFQAGGDAARIPAGSVALVTPYSNAGSSTAMYWQATSSFQFRMPEGEAYVPGGTWSPPPSSVQSALVALDAGNDVAVTPDGRTAALAELRAWQVRTVVVGPSPGQARIERWFSELLGRTPQHTGGVSVWWGIDPSSP